MSFSPKETPKISHEKKWLSRFPVFFCRGKNKFLETPPPYSFKREFPHHPPCIRDRRVVTNAHINM